jgi:hypothetical protein
MKYSRLVYLFGMASLLFFMNVGTAWGEQSTTTCSSGEWDMLSLMYMQQSYLTDNYYVYGTSTADGNVLHNDVPQVATKTGNAWDTGKINFVKDYQAEPGQSSPPYWGYPWDINLFDTSYVYLWITEYSGASEWWSDPYAYKAFNNGSSNYSMRFTRRCVVPGDNGATSQLVNSPSGTYATQFYFVPKSGDNPTDSPTDCGSSSSAQLGYSYINVLSPQSNAFTLQDMVNGGNVTLSLLPVTYRYNCNSSGGCSSEEVYDYGYDASNNYYGLVQWTLYSSTNEGSTWTLVQQSQFNQLLQWTSTELADGKGGTTVSFPCNPV